MLEEKNDVVKVDAEQEIVPVANTLLEAVEAQANYLGAVLKLLPKVCHSRNILDMGGKPFVDDDGCKKMAQLCQLSFSEPKVSESYEPIPNSEEKEFVVRVKGSVSLRNVTVHDEGTCTDKDAFLSARGGLSHNQLKAEVRKKALSNFYGRAVRNILGLRGLSWEDLEKIGFKQGAGGSVNYDTGSKSGRSDGGDDARDKLGEMMINDCNGDKAAAGELLQLLTTFEGKDGNMVQGKSSIAKLTDKQAGYAWGNYKPGGKERANYELQLAEVRRNYGLEEEGK